MALLFLSPWLGRDFVLAPTDILAGQIPGGPTLPGNDPHGAEQNDAVFQFLPWEMEIRRALTAGRLPFWSDTIDGGSSLWANLQAGVLSPIAWLTRFAPIRYFFLIALAAKIVLALLGTLFLARALGAGRRGAWIGALAYALGGGILAWSFFPHTLVLAWVPWLLLAGIRLARRPSRSRFVAASLLVLVVLVSGHPEAAASGLAAFLLLGLFYRRQRKGLFRPLGRLLAAAALGLGLAAIQWLPFLTTTFASQRAAEHRERPAIAEPWAWNEPASWFPLNYEKLLLAPLGPAFFGTPFEPGKIAPVAGWTLLSTGYFGLTALAGCGLALWGRRRRRALPLLGLGVLGLLLAAELAPLRALLHSLPLLELPEYSRFLPVGALCFCLAGALGWAGVLAKLQRPWGRLAALLLVTISLGDLVPWGRALLPRGRPELFFPETPLIAELRREAPPHLYRALGQDHHLYPSLLPAYGVADPRAHNPLVPMTQIRVLRAAFDFNPSTAHYFSPLARPDHPFGSFLGVRSVLSNRFLPQPGLPPAALSLPEPFVLYRNPNGLPRWFLAQGVDIVASDELETWIATMTDPRRVAVQPAEAGLVAGIAAVASPPSIEVLSAEPGHAVLSVAGEGARLLATSLPGPAGWSAQGRGGRLPLLTINGAFLGVVLPPSERIVELRYRPPGLVWGSVLSLVSLILLVSFSASLRERQGLLPPGTVHEIDLTDTGLLLRRHVPPPQVVEEGGIRFSRPSVEVVNLPTVDVDRLIDEERQRFPW